MSPADPVRAAHTLVALQTIQRTFFDVREARRQAILAAVRAGAPLREVARAADCSHESVRRLAAADGATILELGAAQYTLTEQQVEMLIYKLAGSAKGAFPNDIEMLGAGTAWLEAAGELANALQGHQSNANSTPLALDQPRAFALYQILRLTYTGRPTVLSRLYDDLCEQYGQPGQPHVIAELARNRPR